MAGYVMEDVVKHLRARTAVALAAICLSGFGLASPAGAVELVSVAINAMTGNAASSGVASNTDGTVIVFYSDASDLVPADDNGFRDVFVRDFNTGTTERVSVGPGGVEANAPSHAAGGAPAVNSDGSIVVFYSDAFNLVPGDDNNSSDVFVYDRTTMELTRISVAADGGETNGDSLNPTINASGRYIAYQSFASNLIDGDNNGFSDIFLYDRVTGTTQRICDSNPEPNGSSFVPAISPDGFFVAFATSATNLIVGDTNGLVDVYVCNRHTNVYDRVSIGFRGQGNGISILPDVSASGCFVAYKSEADNLVPNDFNERVDVFVRDRSRGITELISEAVEGGSANDASFPPTISDQGRFVAFGSAATDLLFGDVNHVPSVYVRDRETWGIRLVDVNNSGQQADAGTPDVPTGISGDASQIGFVSAASNLTPPGVDRNFTNDVFINDNEFEPLPDSGSVCCDCPGETCVEATEGVCPEDCIPACGAVCNPGPPGNCVFIEVSPTPTPTGPTPTSSPSPTGPTATPTATGPTATATPTGPTATATPTGPTATATPTGPTATATPTGPTATATPTGPTATPTSTATSTAPTATSTPPGTSPTPATATFTPTGPTATVTSSPTPVTPPPSSPTASPTATGPTATFTRTFTSSPTTSPGTPGPGSPTPRRFDDDSCAIAAPSSGPPSNGALLLLIAPLALLAGRKRNGGY
jgi:hypothetical protein